MRARSKQKNISSGLWVCTVHVNRYIQCIYICVQTHLCACSFRTDGWAYKRVRSREAGTHSKTQHNNKPHRPDWLVHPAVACNTPPGWPNPTICKLPLQASGFRRGASSTVSLSHRTWSPWVEYICVQHIYTHIHSFKCAYMQSGAKTYLELETNA